MSWNRRVGLALVLLALSACVALPPGSRNDFVDLCELNVNPDHYLGKTIATRARLFGTAAHGIFADLPECPDIYLDVSVAQDADASVRETYSMIEGILVEPSGQIYSISANVERRRVLLPGTSSSSDRVILLLTDIEPKHTYR